MCFLDGLVLPDSHSHIVCPEQPNIPPSSFLLIPFFSLLALINFAVSILLLFFPLIPSSCYFP